MVQEIEKGHIYDVDHTDGNYTRLVFVHKDKAGTFIHGVTNEDLLAVLILRMSHLVELKDSHDNINTLTYLRQANRCIRERNNRKLQKRDNRGNDIPISAKVRNNGYQKPEDASGSKDHIISEPVTAGSNNGSVRAD